MLVKTNKLELSTILDQSKEAKKAYDAKKFESALQQYLEVANLLNEYYSTKQSPELSDTPIGKIIANDYLATCYFAIGNCYKNLKQDEQALRYLHASLLIQEKATCSLPKAKVEQRIMDTEASRPDTRLDIKFDKYWINVPQGRTCRLIARVSDMQYAGLYSDRFISCVIIVIQSQSRMSMTHLDHMTDYNNSHLEHILNECTWVSKPDNQCKVTILSKPIGQFIKKPIYDIIKYVNTNKDSAFFGKIHLCEQIVANDVNVVKCGFSQGIETNKTIVRPLNLLRHPADYRMHVCRQIEQILYLSNDISPNVTRVIFDGRCWIDIDEIELRPPQLNQDTVKFLQSYQSDDGHLTSVKRIVTFIQSTQEKKSNLKLLESPSSMASTVSQFFCLYASNFAYKKILRQNLLETLKLYSNSPDINLNEKDKIVINGMNAILANSDFSTQALLDILTTLDTNAGSIQNELAQAVKGFLKQLYYSKVELSYTRSSQTIEELAKKLDQAAQEEFFKKNYQAALRLYNEEFVFLAHHVTRGNMTLINTIEKMGNCQILLEDYSSASEFFTMAMTMVKISYPKNATFMTRVGQKLQTCAQKLNTEVPNFDDYVVKKPNDNAQNIAL